MEERRNSYLATGHARTANARTRMRNGWTEIARVLNSEGNGCVKDWKQWAKYWKDKKAATKRKANAAEASRQRTGGGVDDEVVELSELEQKILNIAGGLSFATGDRHLAIDPFPDQAEDVPPPPADSETNSGQSQSLLMQLQNNPGTSACHALQIFSDGTYQMNTAAAYVGEGSMQDELPSISVAAQIATPGDEAEVVNLQNDANADATMFHSHESRRNNEENVIESPRATSAASTDNQARRRILVETPSRRGQTSQPSQRARGAAPTPRSAGAARPTPPGPAETARGAPGAARRRRPLRRSPPSQRRSEMASLTERFIAIEERRADAELTVARAQEMFAQGQHRWAEAFEKFTDVMNVVSHRMIDALQRQSP